MQATVPRLSFRETQPRSLLDRRGRLRVRVIPRSSLSRVLHRIRRIRSLETHVMDIRQSQTAIQNTLVEIVNHLRAGSAGIIRSPSAFPSTYIHPSPNIHADSPASMSTPVSARPPLDAGHTIIPTPQSGSSVRLSPSPTPPKLNSLISLSRCILVLPWPPCGRMGMP